VDTGPGNPGTFKARDRGLAAIHIRLIIYRND
jgi:hypothetical protein